MIRSLLGAVVLGAAACTRPPPVNHDAPVAQAPCVVPHKGEPMMCTQQYEPVCGCDGRTYGNACVATSQGIRRHRPGRCEDPPDGGQLPRSKG